MSFLPGKAIFDERSELNQPRHLFLALLTIIGTISLAILFFRAVDGLFWASTLVTQAIVMVIALVIISQMIANRAVFQTRWGERAFSVAFRWCAIPGLTLIGVGFAHFAWIEGERVLPREIAFIPFVYCLTTGIVLWVRAVFVFGMDNLSMMYVYFPNESRLVNAKIYSVLRHPVYSAAMRVVFALVLWNGSAFALFAGAMAPLTMWTWARLVEERELVERFGEGYREYRRRVPAFFNLNPRTWVTLWKFLILGK